MSKLSAEELDLLQRVNEKEELRALFFRKVKGLKWFDALFENGYFEPDLNPKPIPAKDEVYVSIPQWPVVDYLVKTAAELSDVNNYEYIDKYLQLLVKVTNFARENNYSNYRTWWQLAEIFSQIPYKAINLDHVEIIDYWLNDAYERDLVAQEIGEKWLPSLLEINDEHALQLSKRLIEILYKVLFVERKYGESSRKTSLLRFDSYHAHKITEKVANIAGEKLGKDVVSIFNSQLSIILKELDNDSWSYIWQPAIEVHEQNKHRNDAENILIHAYRDSLGGYISTNPDEAYVFVTKMIGSGFKTIQRLAIYAISRNYHLFENLVDGLLEAKFLDSNYRHEMWHFLNRNYQQFGEQQKKKTLSLISDIEREDDEGNFHKAATAYSKAIWLAAICEYGDEENRLYVENVSITKSEPEHPDFTSYVSVSTGWGESPISLDDLQTQSIDELVEVLINYKDPGRFREPGIEGLVKTFKQLIKTDPLRFYLHLGKFSDLDLAYIHEIIESYRELWTDKSQLPWDDIWKELLDFCTKVTLQERFWDPDNAKQREPFVANRYWIISSIGRLVEAGTKSDDHAFNEKYLTLAEMLISNILERKEGNDYDLDSDAVSISINSPRGHCIEALINMTLRSCRLSDKDNGKDHSGAWAHYQSYYDSELRRADSENPEYEFATLVTNYLPNFLYMSNEWVMNNLDRIFDQDHYLKWLCAMQGYAYVATVYKEIYQYMKEHGDFLKALDDQNIKAKVSERVIQNISIAYINHYESFTDENSLIDTLISRSDFKEISHLIWFIWTLRRNGDEELKNKVYELWPKILKKIDFTTNEGKRIASQLCHWAVFVDLIDDERRKLLLAIAPYSNEAHNSSRLLESIAEISKTQPYEAHTVWMKMLEGSTPDYPENAVRQIFTNLLREGHEGLRKAKEAESEYLKKGNERPSLLLREIRQDIPAA